MQFVKTLTIEIGAGETAQRISAKVTVDMPDIPTECHLDARMVLAAVAANQNLVYASRHHKDRNIRCVVQPELVTENEQQPAKPSLRLVA